MAIMSTKRQQNWNSVGTRYFSEIIIQERDEGEWKTQWKKKNTATKSTWWEEYVMAVTHCVQCAL